MACATALTACSASQSHQSAPRPVTKTAAPAPKSVPVAAARTSAPTPANSTTAAATPCARNHRPKAVLVSVARQHAWLCAHQRLAYDTAVTTGAVDLPYDSTPTGTFHIQAITRNQVLTLLSGDQYTVKYWIPFDAPLFGFHDSSWQKMPYGSQKYRTKGSHGCIHLPLAAIKYLATWASVGTTVRIKA